MAGKGWLIGVALATLAGAARAQPGEVIPIPSPNADAAGQPLCAPARMARMVVRNVSPNLAAAAPQAQPRTLYRFGSMQLRSEESPDPTRGQHNIIIISEPDIWAMNMVTKTGRHQLDPGPELHVRAPVVPLTAEMPRLFLGLEFGCETEFVARHAPQPARMMAWGADRAHMHVVAEGEHSLSILIHERRQAPLLVIYARAGKPVYAIRYDEWRADLPERANLFQPPGGVRFTEGPAGPTPPRLPENPPRLPD